MKTTILGGLFVALAATAASASTVTIAFGDSSKHDPLPGAPGSVSSQRGGEFLVSGSLGNFSSFCLEYDEGISQSSFNYTIDTAVRSGGVGGGSPDPLSAETAELYRRFVSGAITPGVGQSNKDFNNAVQDAFWYLEEELGTVDFTAATAAASSTHFADMNATAQSLVNLVWGTTASVGRVRALNLTVISSGADAQSILYMVAIPLPGAGAMALAGLFGVAAVRRRRVL